MPLSPSMMFWRWMYAATPPAAIAPTVPDRTAMSCHAFQPGLDETLEDADAADLVTDALLKAIGAADSAVMALKTLLTFW